jgi:hypothetical protein
MIFFLNDFKTASKVSKKAGEHLGYYLRLCHTPVADQAAGQFAVLYRYEVVAV